MKRIGNFMRKFAIGLIYVAVTGITKLLRKLKSGNRMVRCATVGSEQRQFFGRYSDSVPHHKQSSLELFNCRYRSWVVVFIDRSGDGFIFYVNVCGLLKHLGNRIWIVALKLFKTLSFYKPGELNRGFATRPERSNALRDDIKLCNNDESGQHGGARIIRGYCALLNLNIFLSKKCFKVRYGFV